jgi:hypothetical protein
LQNSDKLCRFYGENLLQAGSAFHLSEFLEAWKQVCPEGVNPNISQVTGKRCYVVVGRWLNLINGNNLRKKHSEWIVSVPDISAYKTPIFDNRVFFCLDN